MEEEIKRFGPEWIILENITKGGKESVNTVKNILNKNSINWGELIEQSMSHKIFPMVAQFFITNDIFDSIPPFVNQYFRIIWDVNSKKVREIKKQTIKISKELLKHDIPFVATKGIVLDNEIYENAGYRFLSDADFIVKPKYKKQVMQILDDLGFKVGTVDWKNNCIKKLTREEYLVYLNTPDKLPEYVIGIEDEIIKYVSIGFVTSLTWNKCEYHVNIDNAFQKIRMVEIGEKNEKIPALDISYHYIYIILHLYKHAWIEYLSRWNNDVNLAKFGDVYRYFYKYKDILVEELPSIIREQHIEEPIIWTLEHTDLIFNSSIVKELGYENIISDEYLHSAGDKNGNIRHWRGDMRERLKSKDRKKLYY